MKLHDHEPEAPVCVALALGGLLTLRVGATVFGMGMPRKENARRSAGIFLVKDVSCLNASETHHCEAAQQIG